MLSRCIDSAEFGLRPVAPSAVISTKLEALTDHFAPLRSKRIGADSTPRNVPTSPDIVRGRSFTAAERDGEQPVAIVSESIARQLWPNSSGVGGTFRLEQDPGSGTRPKDEPPMPARLVTVVGVSHDVAGFRIIDTREAGIFLPTSVNVPKTSIAARVKGDSALTQRTLVDRLARIDQNLGMVVTMRTLARLETFFLQIAFWVSLVLGGLALLLTVSGLFSVLSVSRRAAQQRDWHTDGARRIVSESDPVDPGADDASSGLRAAGRSRTRRVTCHTRDRLASGVDDHRDRARNRSDRICVESAPDRSGLPVRRVDSRHPRGPPRSDADAQAGMIVDAGEFPGRSAAFRFGATVTFFGAFRSRSHWSICSFH